MTDLDLVARLRGLGVTVTDKGVMKVRASKVLATAEARHHLEGVAAIRARFVHSPPAKEAP
jgi:hypothetical protein